MLKTQLPKNIEQTFIELNLRRKKWLWFSGYNPRKELITNILNKVGIHIDNHLGNYDNLILIGDFNSELEEEQVKDFFEMYNLQNLMKEPKVLI